jgi:Tfp pilus assembly protein PilN
VQPLDLNLASRPFKNNTLLWLGFVLAVVLLGGMTVRNFRLWNTHRLLLADLQSEVAGLHGELESLARREQAALRDIGKHDLELLQVKAEKANEVIQWKTFSWTRLFNRLQEVQPPDVQMTSIHPIFRPESQAADAPIEESSGVPVSVEGLAKNLEAFLELERALFRDPHFSRVEPEGTDVDKNSGETVFSLRFVYDPEGGTAVAAAPPAAPAEQDAPADGEPAPDADADAKPEPDPDALPEV